ncbi:MAG TPA: MlaD family protein [Alphaproteobacteria bacterium]|nr:MlaD family protein [Alphaproteobacteria bacterium]
MSIKSSINFGHIILAVLLTSTVLLLIWVALNFSMDRYRTYKLYTRESVSGLLVGAPVEYKGVDIGKVKNIELKNPHLIEIMISIKKDVLITRGTEATIMTRGLTTRGFTGFVYISLNDKGTDMQPLVAQGDELYPVVPTMPSTTWSLDTTLLRMHDNLQDVSKVFQSVFDQNTINLIKELIDNINKTAGMLAANSQKLDVIIENTQKASKYVEPFLKTSQSTLNLLEKETLPITNRALSQLEPFLESGQKTLKVLETDTLPQVSNVLSRLNETALLLSKMIKEISQNPSILIRGTTQRPPGPGEGNANE